MRRLAGLLGRTRPLDPSYARPETLSRDRASAPRSLPRCRSYGADIAEQRRRGRLTLEASFWEELTSSDGRWASLVVLTCPPRRRPPARCLRSPPGRAPCRRPRR